MEKAPERYMRMLRTPVFAAIATAVVTAVATYALQRYRLASLEECYIFLYDGAYIADTAARAGGPAQLLASLLTQFMGSLWAGAVIAGAMYGAMVWLLAATGRRLQAASWTTTLALLPVLCLWLCLENNSYKFQGHAAMLITLALLALLQRRPTLKGALALTALCYWLAGSMALVLAAGAWLLDIAAGRRRRWWGVLNILLWCLCAQTAYEAQAVPTRLKAFTPAMYYEWETTYYMMLYAWVSVIVCLGAMAWAPRRSKRGRLLCAAVLALTAVAAFNLYRGSHVASVSRIQQQRYLCRQGDWDGILALDYGSEKTPYTSYRTLALAHKGRLVAELPSIAPYIGYYMENKSLVKKEDVQVLSDIFYDCGYMGSARRYAFDTDIVTPGAFNPYETLKLARINIAYGDYAVADKLLRKLGKTLCYAGEASDLRRFLYNDAAVEADPELGGMRRAIPSENTYMSPRKTGAQLRHIAGECPGQTVADQFGQAFTILTGIE